MLQAAKSSQCPSAALVCKGQHLQHCPPETSAGYGIREANTTAPGETGNVCRSADEGMISPGEGMDGAGQATHVPREEASAPVCAPHTILPGDQLRRAQLVTTPPCQA